MDKCEYYDEIASLPDVDLMDCEYKVGSDGFDVKLVFFNPQLLDDDYEDYTINTSVRVDAEVEDFGIGYYEYGSQKCNDVQLGWMVNEIEFEQEFPPNVKAILENLLEKMVEEVGSLRVPSKDDYYD